MHKLLSTAALLLALGGLARAQAPGSTGPAPQAGPAAVPLDAGASLLLASGIALGVRRLRARRAC